METWKILIADGLDDKGQAILRSAAQVEDRQGIAPASLVEIMAGYDALIVRSRTKVTAALLARAPRLKVVGRAGVGVDNIDLAAAAKRGVLVVNAPRATSQAVAEHTLGLMFALARALPRADAAMKAGLWLKKELLGFELHGKVLGIIGAGKIGREVAARASALGMSVLGYDAFIPPEQIREWGLEPVTLADLYSQSDIISLHVPLTENTRGMIGQESLSQMKHGVYLLCTARGGVIDESALLAGLQDGRVAGAALDVFAQEPPGLTDLIAHPRVIATPHIAAQTVEAQARVAIDIAEEVLAALGGQPLRWKVAGP